MTTEAKTPTTGQLVRQRPSGVDDRQARLDELEAVVRRGFYEAGKALREIRDSKLYALREKSWEHHCRNRLESTKTTINRLIDATKTADAALKIAGQGTKMTPIGVTDLVQNEHQARLLKPHLPELNRRVVVEGVDPQEATKAILDRARREEVKAKQAKLEQQLKRQSTSPAQPSPPHHLSHGHGAARGQGHRLHCLLTHPLPSSMR
jgi:hypothetical protein